MDNVAQEEPGGPLKDVMEDEFRAAGRSNDVTDEYMATEQLLKKIKMEGLLQRFKDNGITVRILICMQITQVL